GIDSFHGFFGLALLIFEHGVEVVFVEQRFALSHQIAAPTVLSAFFRRISPEMSFGSNESRNSASVSLSNRLARIFFITGSTCCSKLRTSGSGGRTKSTTRNVSLVIVLKTVPCVLCASSLTDLLTR